MKTCKARVHFGGTIGGDQCYQWEEEQAVGVGIPNWALLMDLSWVLDIGVVVLGGQLKMWFGA